MDGCPKPPTNLLYTPLSQKHVFLYRKYDNMVFEHFPTFFVWISKVDIFKVPGCFWKIPEGFNSSGRLVGSISTTPSAWRTSWCFMVPSHKEKTVDPQIVEVQKFSFSTLIGGIGHFWLQIRILCEIACLQSDGHVWKPTTRSKNENLQKTTLKI